MIWRQPKTVRIAGHSLISEGAPHDDNGNHSGGGIVGVGGVGRAKCECGDLSPVLPSAGRRKAWHRDVHKVEVAAGMRAGSLPTSTWRSR